MAKNYVTIIDNSGRNILGVLKSETNTDITIENPVMILVQPQNGSFQVQLIPLFLAEFIETDDTTKKNFSFTFSKSNVGVGKGFAVGSQITSQYDKVMEAMNAPQGAITNAAPEVIKLFDE